MPVVIDPTYGPKPSQTLIGGSPTTLAQGSAPFLSGGRTIPLVGRLHTISFVEMYRTQPWVARGCRGMTEHIARLPLQTFRYTDAAGDTRKRERQHAAAQLLRRPRPRQTGFHLRWDLALSIYVHGNYVAWKRRPSPGAPPNQLWTLDWRCLIPLMVGGRVTAWEWRGDGVPGLERGEVIDIANTLHVGWGTPGGGDIGISPLEQLGVTVRAEDAAQRYREAYFRNGTRFGVAVILDPKVKADKVLRDGVRAELEDTHGGIDNAFHAAVLGGGITDVKPLGEQTASEAELIAERKINREEITAVIGLPAPIAGILEDTNYAAIAGFERILYVTALGGPLSLISETVQAQLLDDEPAWRADDLYTEFSLGEVLKGDTKTRMEAYALALDHGVLTLNDVRRLENLPPYEDKRADEPLIAANNVRPLSAVGTANAGNLNGRRASDNAAAAELQRLLFTADGDADVDRVAELTAAVAAGVIARSNGHHPDPGEGA